jgi:hypothetical protein
VLRSSLASLCLLTSVLGVGCGRALPPLEPAASSPRELAQAVLAALERRDVDQLRSLALNEREFREHVWPDLPAARPERNLPFSFVWGDLHEKSEAALAMTLSRFGGMAFGLRDVEFMEGTSRYATYVVHRKTSLLVRDVGGRQERLHLFGSVLNKQGRYKVFSYVVD